MHVARAYHRVAPADVVVLVFSQRCGCSHAAPVCQQGGDKAAPKKRKRPSTAKGKKGGGAGAKGKGGAKGKKGAVKKARKR